MRKDEAQTCAIGGQRRTAGDGVVRGAGPRGGAQVRAAQASVMWARGPAVQSHCGRCDALGAARGSHVIKSCWVHACVPATVSTAPPGEVALGGDKAS